MGLFFGVYAGVHRGSNRVYPIYAIIAAYVRVLTKDQNPDLQRVEISAWAKANGIKEVIW